MTVFLIKIKIALLFGMNFGALNYAFKSSEIMFILDLISKYVYIYPSDLGAYALFLVLRARDPPHILSLIEL